MPSLVNNRQHDCRIRVLGREIDAERKLPKQTTPNAALENRKLQWVLFDALQRAIELVNELDQKTCAARAVPLECRADVRGRLGGNDNAGHTGYLLVEYFCRSSARISLQGRAAEGSRP